MAHDPLGRIVSSQPPRDPVDGYQPTVTDGMTPELRAQIADAIESVRAGRFDALADIKLDGYVNEISGIGDYLHDKTKGGTSGVLPMAFNRFTSVASESRQRGSDLGNRIVSVIPNEMTREGWDLTVQPTEDEGLADLAQAMDAARAAPRRAAAGWRRIGAMRRDPRAFDLARRWDAWPAQPEAQPPPPPPGPLPHLNDEGVELGAAMDEKTDALDLLGAVNVALKYEKAFGGAGILIGADDGVTDLSLPLDETKIKSIRHLTPYFGGWDGEIVAWSWYVDPRAPKFGQPEVYMLRNLGVPLARPPAPGSTNPPPQYVPTGPTGPMVFYVHESRFLLFPGSPPTRRVCVENRGWDDSIFTRVDEVLSQYDQSWGGIAIILQEFSIATLAIEGLTEMLTSKDPKMAGGVLRRAQMLGLSQSVARTRLVDANGEKFERVTASVAGVEGLMSQFALRLAAACDMPVSLLMGQVKGGLGDAGSTDVRFFYDKIASAVRHRLIPRLKRIYRLLWLAKDSPTAGVEPNRWSITPRALWQMTEAEKADIRYKQAQTDQIYIQSGVLEVPEVTASRFGGSEWSGETTLDLEGRQQGAERDAAAAKAQAALAAAKPPPPAGAPSSVGPGPMAEKIPPIIAAPTDPITGDPTGTPSTVGNTAGTKQQE